MLVVGSQVGGSMEEDESVMTGCSTSDNIKFEVMWGFWENLGGPLKVLRPCKIQYRLIQTTENTNTTLSQFMFWTDTGLVVGKNSSTDVEMSHTDDMIPNTFDHLPSDIDVTGKSAGSNITFSTMGMQYDTWNPMTHKAVME